MNILGPVLVLQNKQTKKTPLQKYEKALLCNLCVAFLCALGYGLHAQWAFKYSATVLSHLDLTVTCSSQPTREDHCGMNGEEKGANEHLRFLELLILSMFSHPVHGKIIEMCFRRYSHIMMTLA